MYQFYYDVLVPAFDSKHLKLLYSDTDSFLVHISGVPNIDEILWKNRGHFDFSSLPDHHRLKDNRNKEVTLFV